jgi:hypothetical protein
MKDVELAVLSAVAHGKHEGVLDVALPTIRALGNLAEVDAERSGVYLDLVLGAVSSAARAALEPVMKSNYEYQSDFARHYYGQGEANALLRVLAARGFAVDAATDERVRACSDLKMLERWLTRAATAAALSDVFDDG